MSYFDLNWINLYLENKSDLIIFDVGAFDFSDSLRFKQVFPNSKIYSFEADEINYNNYSLNAKQKGILTNHLAVSDKSEILTFYGSKTIDHRMSGNISNWTCSGSLLKSGGKNKDVRIEFDCIGTKVQGIRIDDFCKMNNINHINVMHMDIQGNEYNAIKGLGDNKDIYPKILFCETCEFETYESGVTLNDFDNLVLSLGYRLEKRLKFDSLYILN
jgi:FkbM family methyltransferase